MSVVEKRERKSILVSCGSNAHRDLGPPFLGLPNTSAAQSGAHGLKSPYVQRVKIGGQREKDTVQVDERDPTPPPTHTHTTQNKSDQRAPHAAAAATTMPISGDRGETLPAVGKKERKPFEATDKYEKKEWMSLCRSISATHAITSSHTNGVQPAVGRTT